MAPHILVQVDSESNVSRVEKKHFRDQSLDGMEKEIWLAHNREIWSAVLTRVEQLQLGFQRRPMLTRQWKFRLYKILLSYDVLSSGRWMFRRNILSLPQRRWRRKRLDSSMLENLVSTCNVTRGYKFEDTDLNAQHLQKLKYHVRKMFKSDFSDISWICRRYMSWNSYQKVDKFVWNFRETLDIFRRVCAVFKFAVLLALDKSFWLVVWCVPDDQGIWVRLQAKSEIFSPPRRPDNLCLTASLLSSG